MGKISTLEFRRRIFNEAVLTCMNKIQGEILNGCTQCNCENDVVPELADKLCRSFYTDLLSLDTSTVDTTKNKLSEGVSFMHDVAKLCETIANDKAEEAKDQKMELTDDQKAELSEDDKALIDQLFNAKSPDLQVDKVRDATVKALLTEDRKAQEIRDAVDIAKSQVSADANPAALEETINRLNGRGPTSLMNAILNSVSTMAIRDVNESGNFVTVGKIMSENADQIKTRAVIAYSLYETASVFGLHRYTPAEIKNLTENIYYGK